MSQNYISAKISVQFIGAILLRLLCLLQAHDYWLSCSEYLFYIYSLISDFDDDFIYAFVLFGNSLLNMFLFNDDFIHIFIPRFLYIYVFIYSFISDIDDDFIHIFVVFGNSLVKIFMFLFNDDFYWCICCSEIAKLKKSDFNKYFHVSFQWWLHSYIYAWEIVL